MESTVPTEAPMSGDVPSPQQAPEGVSPQNDVPMHDPDAPVENTNNDINDRIEQEKEFYRQKKQLKEREAEIERREQTVNTPKTVDEMLDDILQNNETQEPEEQQMSQEEIIEEAKRQIREEFEREGQEFEQEQDYERAVEEFGGEVSDMVEANRENFPLLAEMGVASDVSSDVREEYDQLAEEYGEEYADRWYSQLDWGQVFTNYENEIAENFRAMLQSPSIRQIMKSYLGDENQVPSGEPPRTLRQDDTGTSANGGLSSMTVDERVAYAKAQLRKQGQPQY